MARPPQDPISLALLACRQIVTAYAQSEEYDADLDRSEIDEAYATAAKALSLVQQDD